jgi:hypothetical protein
MEDDSTSPINSGLNNYTTLDVSNYYKYITAPTYTYPTINSTIGSGALYSNNSGLKVTGPAEFEGDVKIKGKSIVDRLDAIEKRLSILTPDPKKLDKYEALQKAYAHYKTLEKLCFDDDDK